MLASRVKDVKEKEMWGASHQQLYLKLGDEVIHDRYPQWGVGVVVEESNSTMTGGLCMVRIIFRDGEERCFINNLSDHNCCYYAGLRLYCQDS